jgi:hypothetical protein
MARRKSRQKQPPKPVPQQDSGDKENQRDVENLLQSPTPYWKVAKERGISPTETRSTKKSKKQPSDEDDSQTNRAGRLLVFSPPDQKANAKREKEELERNEKERCVSNIYYIVFLSTRKTLH